MPETSASIRCRHCGDQLQRMVDRWWHAGSGDCGVCLHPEPAG